jgi:transcriptional regulator
MYQPLHFQDHDTANHHDLIRACPLGLLISAGGGGLMANPIPFVLDGQANVLRCHLARPNGQWKEFLEPQEVLVVFRGTDHYIHPGWYPSKRENGKVVPTWNYAMVQVHGQARVMDDPVWLGRQIRDLTVMMEGGMPAPWAVDDAPEAFINAQIRGIVGVEIAITAMHGKWKTSQNRSQADAQGVVEGLNAIETEQAAEMADMVKQRIKPLP